MFMLPSQFTDYLLVDSLEHVRPRLSNDVLSDYWRAGVDYHYQWLVTAAQVPQSVILSKISTSLFGNEIAV